MRDDRDESGGSAAERLRRAAAAARELSDALWDLLQQELSQTSSEHTRALARRLGEVSATVALLLEASSGEQAGASARALADQPLTNWPQTDQAPAGQSPAGQAQGGQPQWERSQAGQLHTEQPQDDRRTAERRTPPEPIPGPSESFAPGARESARLVDERQATVMPFSPAARGQAERAEISIHDVRREEGPAAWISSVGRMLLRHSEDRLPFAVLLIEIVDVAHLERSETPHHLHGIVAQVERALGRGMRTSDELSRETLGRYWLLAPETNGTGARMLAERLAGLVRGSATHRGVPMEVAIGIAVCPEDGTDAPALAARADLGVYTARATGRSVARTDPPVRGDTPAR